MDLDAVRTFVAAADAGQFQEAAASAVDHPAGRLQAHRRAGEGPGRAPVHPHRARRPAHHRRPGVPAPRPRTSPGRGAGRRLRPSRPARAARRRDRPAARDGGAAARLPPRASRDRTRRRDPRRRRGHRRRRAGTIDASFRASPARAASARRHRGRPGARRAASNSSPARPTRSPPPARSPPRNSPDTGSGCPASSPAPSGPPTTTTSPPRSASPSKSTGPDFGTEPLLDAIADSPTLATLVGEQTRLAWPAHHDLRRIPLHTPTPVYPHSLLSRPDNPHPTLTTLHTYLISTHPNHAAPGTWTPKWAQ